MRASRDRAVAGGPKRSVGEAEAVKSTNHRINQNNDVAGSSRRLAEDVCGRGWKTVVTRDLRQRSVVGGTLRATVQRIAYRLTINLSAESITEAVSVI